MRGSTSVEGERRENLYDRGWEGVYQLSSGLLSGDNKKGEEKDT